MYDPYGPFMTFLRRMRCPYGQYCNRVSNESSAPYDKPMPFLKHPNMCENLFYINANFPYYYTLMAIWAQNVENMGFGPEHPVAGWR